MITFAVPKGRILNELIPFLNKIFLAIPSDIYDETSRKLIFANSDNHRFIKVRSFDVATFVATAGADIGVVGSDVLSEFGMDNLYSPIDLNIGKCRLVLAGIKGKQLPDSSQTSHLRVATKYPNLTSQFFATRGISAEIIKLNGAIELAAALGMADYIVDLVDTGNTLCENGLEPLVEIMNVSSRLVVNKASMKLKAASISPLITAAVA